MRVIAHNVEYFDLMRDQGTLITSPYHSLPESPATEDATRSVVDTDRGLRDSLWYFDGESVRCWMDVKDVLGSVSAETECDLPQPVSIPTDFYPTVVMLHKGIVLGLDTDLIQRWDIHFAFVRHTIRVSFP